MITRFLYAPMQQALAKGKAVVVLGPRQVGKTTLLGALVRESGEDALYLDADEPDVRQQLTAKTSTELRNLIGANTLIAIDEAQRIKDIGLTLKLILDKIKSVKVLVSGSSALELSNTVNEPLTGRKFEFLLLPFSTAELVAHHGELEEGRQLEQRLRYGFYPEIVIHPAEAAPRLTELVNGYLYRDIFSYQDVRRPELLSQLLEALARQMGQEVSYHELASLLGVNAETIKRYIDLLEKSYVIFRLRSYSKNLRTELKKSRKIYFYDNGVRNAILGNYQPLGLRTDAGALWENFCISERYKQHLFSRAEVRSYFWRTKQQQEIDLIEEANGQLRAYEFKWNPATRAAFSTTFTAAYHPTETLAVHRENYLAFFTKAAA